MNKLVKLLALGTVLPLSLNSLNLVSVSYSSNNSLSTGVEDFTWAEEAFKLPKQCFERISYLVNENIKAKARSFSNKCNEEEYWANKAITDKNAVYSESIKNLKIIYTVVCEQGKKGLESLRNGIVVTIRNMLSDCQTDEEATAKKLEKSLGYFNALLIAETVNEWYRKKNENDEQMLFKAQYFKDINESIDDLYSDSFNNMVGILEKRLDNDSNRSKKLLVVLGNVIDKIKQSKNVKKDKDQHKNCEDAYDESLGKLYKYMRHDWDCYLRQIGIIDDIEIIGYKYKVQSVGEKESKLMRMEGNFLLEITYDSTLGPERLETITSMCDNVSNKKSLDDLYMTLKKNLETKENGGLLGDIRRYTKSRYNYLYLEFITNCQLLDIWKKQKGAKFDIYKLLLSSFEEFGIRPKLQKILISALKIDNMNENGTTLINLLLSRIVVGLNNFDLDKPLFEKSDDLDTQIKQTKKWLKQYLEYYNECCEIDKQKAVNQMSLLQLGNNYLANYINRMIHVNVDASTWSQSVNKNIDQLAEETGIYNGENSRLSDDEQRFLLESVYLKAVNNIPF